MNATRIQNGKTQIKFTEKHTQSSDQLQNTMWRIQDFPNEVRQPLLLERKPIVLQDFSPILHENERN